MSCEGLTLVGRAVRHEGRTVYLDRGHDLREGDILAASHVRSDRPHLRGGRLRVIAAYDGYRSGAILVEEVFAIASLVTDPEYGDWLYLVKPERPPVEHYIRCSVAVGDLVVEPGLELREGDDAESIAADLERVARQIGFGAPYWGDRARYCAALTPSFEAIWPGRAWFVELHDAKLERWTQSYQPYGIPRSR